MVSLIFSELFYKLGYPRTLGPLIAGLILGLPFFSFIFTNKAVLDIQFLSELGILFLLIIVGLEINIGKMKKFEKDVFFVSMFSSFIPFGFGFITAYMIGYSAMISFVVGITIAITSEATQIDVLLGLRKMNSKIGVIMVGSGIVDILFEVIFLASIFLLSHNDVSAIAWFPFKVMGFAAITYLAYLYSPKILFMIHKEKSKTATFSAILVFSLIMAAVASQLGLGPVIGGLIAGIIIHISENNKKEYAEMTNELKMMAFSFIVPFFFINIGLHIDYSLISKNIPLILLFLAVAIISKILGALLAVPFTDLTINQATIIGWAGCSRAAIELVIIDIARTTGLIPLEIYSSLVITSIISTLIFPIAIKHMIKKNPNIMQ